MNNHSENKLKISLLSEVRGKTYEEICATRIRSCYVSHKIRKKVKFFSRLPRDIWLYILFLMHNRITIFERINAVVHKRIIILDPNFSSLHDKLQTLRLIKKYRSSLSTACIRVALIFCLRFLETFTIRNHPLQIFFVNSVIETILTIAPECEV